MEKNKEDREDTTQSNILSTCDIVSETLQTEIDKGLIDEEGTEPKVYIEEIKNAEDNGGTRNSVNEEGKESAEASKIADKKSFGKLPQTKSKFKKRPTALAARKVSGKVPGGSESDEEDVRMENSSLPSDVTKVSKSDDFDPIPKGAPATKAKIVFAKKRSFPPKAFGAFGKNDNKPNRRPKNFVLPADQMAKLSKSFDEMEKRYGLVDESSGKNNRDKGVKTKKNKAMMDFGSEAEYTDEDSSQTTPDTKDDENESDKSAVSFKPTFRPKQFQARVPTNQIKNKTPTKSDPQK